jgi:hypothetical protein
MQRLLQFTPFLSDPITRLEFEQREQFIVFFVSEVDQSNMILQCRNLKDFVAGSQTLLDIAASFLDDALFNQEEFEACFDFVFDLFFTRAFSVVIDYCNRERNVRLSVWGQAEFIILATWASNFERLVLKYDESKLDRFNVLDQGWFVALMDVYSNAQSQGIGLLISNLIELHIRDRPQPCMLIEGPLNPAVIVDLMTVIKLNLENAFRTGSGLIATSLMTKIEFLPVLEAFPMTYLKMMDASFPIEHVVSVLNGFWEASEWIKLGCPVNVNGFQQICFNPRSPKWSRKLLPASGAFNRALKEGSRIVAHVMAANLHPLIQNVGDESWVNGSVTADWLATVRDYFGDLRRWMVPAVFHELSADTFDDNLCCYVKALLSGKINIDQRFVDRAYRDLKMIELIFLEYADIDVVNARIQLMIGFEMVVKAKLESSNLISDAEIHSWRHSFKSNLREGSNTLNLAKVQAIVESFGETIDVTEHEVSKCFELRENVDRVGEIDCIEFEVVMKMLKDLTLSRGFFSRGSASAVEKSLEMGVGAAGFASAAAFASEAFASAAAFASEAFASAAVFASSAAAFCATPFSNSLSARPRVTSWLQTVISGDWDVEDLAAHAKYEGCTASSHTVVKLMKVLREFTPQQRSLFLKFVTSCPRPPLLGFCDLQVHKCLGNRLRDMYHVLTLPAHFPPPLCSPPSALFSFPGSAGFSLSATRSACPPLRRVPRC